MFTVSFSRYGEPTRHYDLHALPIAGTMAHKLGPGELYRELLEIGVPGIAPQLGLQDFLIAYARFRETKPPDPPTDTRGGPQIIGSAAVGKNGETA